GMMLFVPESEHWATLAAVNSAAFIGLLHLLMARGTRGGQTLKYESGYVGATPLPSLKDTLHPRLAALAQQGWLIGYRQNTHIETSHTFALPSLLQVHAGSLSRRTMVWLNGFAGLNAKRSAIQREIDDICFALY